MKQSSISGGVPLIHFPCDRYSSIQVKRPLIIGYSRWTFQAIFVILISSCIQWIRYDKRTSQANPAQILISLVVFVIVIAGMHAAESILVPFLLSIFIALTL